MKKRYILTPVGILLFLFVILREGPYELLQTLLTGDLSLILAAEIFFVSIALIKAFRLHKIVTPLKSIKKLSSFKVFYLGQLVNQGLVSIGGDLSKAGMLKKFYKFRISKALSAVVTERVFDFAFILFLSSFIFFEVIPTNSMKLAFLPPITALALVFLVIFCPFKLLEKIGRFKKPYEILYDFRTYIKNLKRDRILFLLGITIFAWIFEGVGNAILFYSFGVELSLILVLAVTAISLMVGFLSMIPGGFGTREATMILLYSQFGVGGEIVISVALIYRFLVALNDVTGYIVSQTFE